MPAKSINHSAERAASFHRKRSPSLEREADTVTSKFFNKEQRSCDNHNSTLHTPLLNDPLAATANAKSLPETPTSSLRYVYLLEMASCFKGEVVILAVTDNAVATLDFLFENLL